MVGEVELYDGDDDHETSEQECCSGEIDGGIAGGKGCKQVTQAEWGNNCGDTHDAGIGTLEFSLGIVWYFV